METPSGSHCSRAESLVAVASPTDAAAVPSISPKRQRRLGRFSLRTLLLGVTLASFGMAFFYHRFERQRRAVAAIEAVGGSVRYFTSEAKPGPVAAWLRSRMPQSYFDRVRLVDLYHTQHADQGLAQIEELDAVEWVILSGSTVTEAGFARLGGLPRLKRIDGDSLSLADQALAPLGRLPLLHEVSLSYTSLSDQGVAHLDPQRQPHLEVLCLNDTRITDLSLEHAAQFRSLKKLWVARTEITDNGLRHLASLPHLENLDLTGTGITDAGLVHLQGLTSLRDLHLQHTQITPAGKQRLRESLPNCLFR